MMKFALCETRKIDVIGRSFQNDFSTNHRVVSRAVESGGNTSASLELPLTSMILKRQSSLFKSEIEMETIENNYEEQLEHIPDVIQDDTTDSNDMFFCQLCEEFHCHYCPRDRVYNPVLCDICSNSHWLANYSVYHDVRTTDHGRLEKNLQLQFE